MKIQNLIVLLGFAALACQASYASYNTLPPHETAQCPEHGEFFHDNFCRLGTNANGALNCIPCPDQSKPGFLANGVIRGGQPTAKGIEFLKKIGVGFIVDLRTPAEDRNHLERDMTSSLGISYIDLPLAMESSGVGKNLDLTSKALEAIAKFREAHPDQLIYIHCQRGEDRTGLQIAAYRKAVENADPAAIEHEMSQHYFNWNYPGLAEAWKRIKSKSNP
jgi:rhodanese-related sulfurtransferase